MASGYGYYIGLDGGGTKSAAVLLRVQEDGSSWERVAYTRVGATNRNSAGNEVAQRHLSEALRSLLEQASLAPHDVSSVCVGMAGVDRPDDKALVHGWLRALFPDARTSVHVHSDAVTALASGTNGKLHGVVLISGTGTVAMGFKGADVSARCAGWGPLLGDRGSGYWIGAEILAAVTRAADGNGPETGLLPAVLAHLELSKPQDLIGWAYRDTQWQRFAALSPLATKLAAEGDQVAQSILQRACEGLTASVRTVLRRLEFQPDGSDAVLVLAGGTLTHDGSELTRLVRNDLLATMPSLTVVTPSIAVEEAAALLAYHQHQHNLTIAK